MTSILDILMDYCYLRGYQYSRLDGSMKYADREENVCLFLVQLTATIFTSSVTSVLAMWIQMLSILCRWGSSPQIQKSSSSSWALELVALGSTSQLQIQSLYLIVTGYVCSHNVFLHMNFTTVNFKTFLFFIFLKNPQADLQAQDRCHRIGQTKPVVVYRLITVNTIDEKILERASAKRKLEKMVIHKSKFINARFLFVF